MECPIGLLIDLETFHEIKNFESENLPVLAADLLKSEMPNSTLSDDFLGKAVEKDFVSMRSDDHHLPRCEYLIDLDFSETYQQNNNIVEDELISLEEKTLSYSSEKYMSEESNLYSELSKLHRSELLSCLCKRPRELSNTLFINDDQRIKNISWSPAKCSDVDLLENEKFDFSMSISPYRAAHIEAESKEERGFCSKCSCKKNYREISNSQKSWNMFSASFMSEISDQSPELVTHSVSIEKNDGETDANLLDFSSLGHIEKMKTEYDTLFKTKGTTISALDSDPQIFTTIKQQKMECNTVSDIQVVMEKMSVESETAYSKHNIIESTNVETDLNFQITTDLDQNVVSLSLGNVTNMNLNGDGISQINDAFLSNNTSILKEKHSFSQMEFSKTETFLDSDKSSVIKSKEDIVILISNDNDKENSGIAEMEFALKEIVPFSDSNESKEAEGAQRATNPLIRKETFTIKASPLHEINFKTPEIKNGVEKYCNGIRNILRKQERKSLVSSKTQNLTPTSAFKIERSLERKKSPLSKKEKLHGLSSSSIKEPQCKLKAAPILSHSTPVKRLNKKHTPVIDRVANFSSKLEKSLVNQPLLIPVIKQKKSPKVSGRIISKTPIAERKLGVLPSRLSRLSMNARTSSEITKVGTPNSNSNAPSKLSASSTTSGNIKPFLPAMQQFLGKTGSSNASRDSFTELLKRNPIPLKAQEPLSNMMKASSASNLPATCVSGISVGRTLSTPKANSKNNVVSSAPAISKRSSSVSTPKCASTPIKSRFLSQSKTPTPVSIKKDGARKHSLVPTPKSFTPKKFTEGF